MSYPPPPYNPSAPPPGQPGQQAVGFEQYQQGGYPPPYSTYPSQYPPQQYPPQQQYPQQQYGNYSPYGHPQGVYTEQPKTVYVYDDRNRRRDNGADGADCFLWGLCAACLCCCLLDS